jgi:hypothetical protein
VAKPVAQIIIPVDESTDGEEVWIEMDGRGDVTLRFNEDGVTHVAPLQDLAKLVRAIKWVEEAVYEIKSKVYDRRDVEAPL